VVQGIGNRESESLERDVRFPAAIGGKVGWRWKRQVPQALAWTIPHSQPQSIRDALAQGQARAGRGTAHDTKLGSDIGVTEQGGDFPGAAPECVGLFNARIV
jgi:hypothetical protein